MGIMSLIKAAAMTENTAEEIYNLIRRKKRKKKGNPITININIKK